MRISLYCEDLCRKWGERKMGQSSRAQFNSAVREHLNSSTTVGEVKRGTRSFTPDPDFFFPFRFDVSVNTTETNPRGRALWKGFQTRLINPQVD